MPTGLVNLFRRRRWCVQVWSLCHASERLIKQTANQLDAPISCCLGRLKAVQKLPRIPHTNERPACGDVALFLLYIQHVPHTLDASERLRVYKTRTYVSPGITADAKPAPTHEKKNSSTYTKYVYSERIKRHAMNSHPWGAQLLASFACMCVVSTVEYAGCLRNNRWNSDSNTRAHKRAATLWCSRNAALVCAKCTVVKCSEYYYGRTAGCPRHFDWLLLAGIWWNRTAADRRTYQGRRNAAVIKLHMHVNSPLECFEYNEYTVAI